MQHERDLFHVSRLPEDRDSPGMICCACLFEEGMKKAEQSPWLDARKKSTIQQQMDFPGIQT